MMMKPEEVIELLKIQREDCSASVLREDDIDYAIEALEKQIPKKPERLNAFRSIGKCRGCERVISARNASVYCMYCGNKVDWRNEE